MAYSKTIPSSLTWAGVTMEWDGTQYRSGKLCVFPWAQSPADDAQWHWLIHTKGFAQNNLRSEKTWTTPQQAVNNMQLFLATVYEQVYERDDPGEQ